MTHMLIPSAAPARAVDLIASGIGSTHEASAARGIDPQVIKISQSRPALHDRHMHGAGWAALISEPVAN